MNFVIRECTFDDVDYIYKLNCIEMGYDHPIENTRKQLKMVLSSCRDIIYVAVLDEKIVGYVHANDYNLIYAPPMKNIMGIAVSGEYKKIGIGKALLNAVENWAKADGAKGVRLVSGATRKEAHEFYKRCGYCGGKQQLNFKKYFEESEGDEMYMKKELTF